MESADANTVQPPAYPGEVWFDQREPGEPWGSHLTSRHRPRFARVSIDGHQWQRVEIPEEVDATICYGAAAIRGHLDVATFAAVHFLVTGQEVCPDDVRHGWARNIRDFQTDRPMLQLCDNGRGAFPVTLDAARWTTRVPDAFNASRRRAQRVADDFNAKHDVGTPIIVQLEDGEELETATAGEAYVVALTARVSVQGRASTVALERVEVVE